MTRKLFGTDGIRGLANRGDMTPEVAFRIGAAIAYQAGRRVKHVPRIVVGKDTRLSGYLFETAVASGICALGGEVLLSGPLPTPAIAHLTTSMRADAGFVISASHNPYQDNGIKIFGPDGFKLPDAVEHEIEELVFGSDLDAKRPTGTRVGRAERLDDAPGRYVAFVKASFPDELTLEGVRIVVDAAHGAAYRTAPLVFSELGATTHAIGVRPNGKNINHKVGALHPENCAREVRRRNADLGIALDGDADRVMIIDEKGVVADGDQFMALIADRWASEGRLLKGTLVSTVMSNLGLERHLQGRGLSLLRTAVGDRYVVEAMRDGGYNLGGEQSGHIVMTDYVTTGDGLIAGLQFLSAMVETGKRASELAQVFTPFPQLLQNVRYRNGAAPLEQDSVIAAIAAGEARMNGSGRLVIRKSGTEPLVRIMGECEDADLLREIVGGIETEVAKFA